MKYLPPSPQVRKKNKFRQVARELKGNVLNFNMRMGGNYLMFSGKMNVL